jgi:hypothetical protein
MGALSRRNGARDWQLTDQELQYLHADPRMPDDVKALLTREGATLTQRVGTLRAMRERLEEERKLQDEYARFQGFKDMEAMVEVLEAKERMHAEENAALTREVAALRQQLRQVTARPAMATDAEPTGR